MRPIPHLLPALVIGVLLAGCGGGGSAADESSAGGGRTSSGADEDRIVVAALGDSITAGSPLWDPDPAVREEIGSVLDERSQFEYWAHREDPAVVYRNCGVYGERTDQIALRLDRCARGADILLIQGGINDIVQGSSPRTIAGNLRAMIARARHLEISVAVAQVLPWNNGHPAADSEIDAVNRQILEIAEAEGVSVLGFHDAIESSSVPGTMPHALTIDGDHPSVAGYRLLAKKEVVPFVEAKLAEYGR